MDIASISIILYWKFQHINLEILAFMVFKFKHYDNVECHHVVKIKVSEIYCTCSNYVMRILLVVEARYEFFSI
jgi:hypothetical protein